MEPDYSLVFNEKLDTIVFTDNSAYDYPSAAAAAVNLVNPLGEIIIGPADSQSPNLDPDVSTEISVNGITRYIDSNRVVHGDWSLSFSAAWTENTTQTPLSVIVGSGGAGGFEFEGFLTPVDNGNGGALSVASGPNAGLFTRASFLLVPQPGGGFNTQIFVNENVVDDPGLNDVNFDFLNGADESRTITILEEQTDLSIADLSHEVDLLASRLLVNDVTPIVTGGALTSRTIQAIPPALATDPDTGQPVPTFTGSDATLLVTPIYTKTWLTSLVKVVTFNYGNDTFVVTYEASESVVVTNLYDFCAIADVLNAFEEQYKAVCSKPGYSSMETELNSMHRLFNLLGAYQSCGDDSKAAVVYADLKAKFEAQGVTLEAELEETDTPQRIEPPGGLSTSGASLPFKLYAANITFSSSPSVGLIFNNDLDGEPVFTRESAGIFRLTLNGEISPLTTTPKLQLGGGTFGPDTPPFTHFITVSTNYIEIRLYTGSSLWDPISYSAYLEIKVYEE